MNMFGFFKKKNSSMETFGLSELAWNALNYNATLYGYENDVKGYLKRFGEVHFICASLSNLSPYYFDDLGRYIPFNDIEEAVAYESANLKGKNAHTFYNELNWLVQIGLDLGKLFGKNE